MIPRLVMVPLTDWSLKTETENAGAWHHVNTPQKFELLKSFSVQLLVHGWRSGFRSLGAAGFDLDSTGWSWSETGRRCWIRSAKRHQQFHSHKSCAWRSRGQISGGEYCDKLKDVYYDIQGVLDEWIENASKINKNVRSFIPAYRFSPKQLVLCRDIADRKNPRFYI